MIPYHLHHAACAALLIAALYRLFTAGKQATAHRFLFPFIVTAFGFGAIASYLIGMEFFTAWYSGSVDPATGKPRPLATAGYLLCLPVFPLLPGLGLIPAIGRRPLAVALLAVAGTGATWIMHFGS
jgi:hypothetical protein